MNEMDKMFEELTGANDELFNEFESLAEKKEDLEVKKIALDNYITRSIASAMDNGGLDGKNAEIRKEQLAIIKSEAIVDEVGGKALHEQLVSARTSVRKSQYRIAYKRRVVEILTLKINIYAGVS